MFSKIALALFTVSALSSGVISTPLSYKNNLARQSSYSFDNWGGISSMSGFDNFYGSDDFSGSEVSQTVVTAEATETEVVCHSESVEIIQQRLVVLREMAFRIITEQICEVETQTFVFQQFTSSFSSFQSDLSRSSGRSVGYDSSIAGHYGDLVNSDGSLSSNDLGFSGSDVGSSTVVPSGNNWSDSTSPSSVGNALVAIKGAKKAQQQKH